MQRKDQLQPISILYLVLGPSKQAAAELSSLLLKSSYSASQFLDIFLDSLTVASLSDKFSITLNILNELKFSNGSINLSQHLINALLKLFNTNHSEKSLILSILQMNFEKIDPEHLFSFSKAFNIIIPNSEIINYALYLLMLTNNSNNSMKHNTKKAVVLLKHFDLIVKSIQKQFLMHFDLISFLVEEKSFEYLKIVIDKDKDLATKAIYSLCQHKEIDTAEGLLNIYNLSPYDFPVLIKKTKKSALFYFWKEGVAITKMMELTEDCPFSTAALIEVLIDLSSSDKNLENPVIYLAKNNPSALEFVKPERRLLIDLNKTVIYSPRQNEWGPINKNCSHMPDTPVYFIQTQEDLEAVSWEGAEVVAIDSEWRTDLGKYSQNKENSILQIALTNRIYLIDLIALHKLPLLDSKLYQLFGNAAIIKVGIGLIGDISRLKESYGDMMSFQCTLFSYLDLIEVHKGHFKTSPGGLANLTEIHLGCTLCKGEQKSNWNKRPLSLTQLHYAAMDVYVCLCLFYKYKELGIDISKEIVNISVKNENLNKSVQENMPTTCEICKSKVHTAAQCFSKCKCKICGYADHESNNCSCFSLG